MKSRTVRKRLITLVTLVVLLVAVVPVALAWPFGDVPSGHWAYNAIRRIAYLNITSGCGGGNFCPGNYVTRAQMAGFMDNLTKANTTQAEPYILNLNHSYPTGNYDAIISQSESGDGVYAISYGGGNADNGVFGYTNSTYAYEAGVYGYSASNAAGLIGASAQGFGAWLQGGTGDPSVALAEYGSDDGELWANPAQGDSDLFLHSNDEVWVLLDENNSTSSAFAVYNGTNYRMFAVDEVGNFYGNWTNGNADTYFRVRDNFVVDLDDTNDGTVNGVFWVRNETDNVRFWVNTYGDAALDDDMYIGGNLSVTGSKSSIAPTSQGDRLLYAVESPENWFEDFGSGALVEGSAVVDIDPLFLETVNPDVGYHVFLTPLGDCNGLYVAAKSPTSFEVQELGGGSASIDFDYRIVVKRLGYEGVRLDLAPEFDEDGQVGYDEVDTLLPTQIDDEAPVPDEPTIIEIQESEEEEAPLPE